MNKCSISFKTSSANAVPLHEQFKQKSMCSKGVGCMIGVHCHDCKNAIKRTEDRNIIRLRIKVHNRMAFFTVEFTKSSRSKYSHTLSFVHGLV